MDSFGPPDPFWDWVSRKIIAFIVIAGLAILVVIFFAFLADKINPLPAKKPEGEDKEDH